jgi:hypothetical protein
VLGAAAGVRTPSISAFPATMSRDCDRTIGPRTHIRWCHVTPVGEPLIMLVHWAR